jgi:hypothetical protein
MGLIRPSVLLLALLMSAPALYRYFISQDLDVTSALGRYLLAVPVAALMLALVRFVTAGYGRKTEPVPPTLQGNQPATGEPEPVGSSPES